MLIGESFNCMEIVKRYNLVNFLIFNCTVPYELKIDIDTYSIKINDVLSSYLNNEEISRNIVYAVTKRCIENQLIPSKSAFVFDGNKGTYSTFVTDIVILVEVNKKDDIDNLFISKIGLMEVFQNSLTIFSSKYNEAVSGDDFLIVTASETGLQMSRYFCRNYIDGSYDLKNALITSGFEMPKTENHKKEDLHKIMQEPYIMWRYFFNKAKYSYDTYDNLECILSSAISIESYIQERVNVNNLNEELRLYISENNIKNISFFQITSFLKKKKVLSKSEEDFLNKIFGKISGMRNDIVHGKITTPILSRKKAEIAKTGIVELYSRFENLSPIIKEEPKLPLEYYFNKAFSYINNGYKFIKEEKYDEAIEIFSNNIKKGMYLDYSYYNRGICYFKKNFFQEAINDFSICIENKFYLLESLYNRSLSEVRVNKNEEALDDLNLALKIDDKQARLYANKGLAYINKRKYEEAIKEFDISLSLLEEAMVYYNRGVAYHRIGNLKKAFEDFEKAIEMDEKDKYLYEIALLYQENGEYCNAIKLLDKLIFKYPQDDGYLNIRGNCYRALKNYKKAKQDYEKAITVRPEYYLGYMNLGVVYMDFNELDLAKKNLFLSLEKSPGNTRILENIDILYVNYALKRYIYIGEAKEGIKRLLINKPNDEELRQAETIIKDKYEKVEK